MKHVEFRHLLVPCLIALSSTAMAEDWVSDQGISYWCGGVGDASQAELKGAESSADAQLVMTAGSDRAYLSDVKLTVTSADKQHSTSWQASGPICLLKLPQGNFNVEAAYGDERRSAAIAKKPAKAGATPPLIINFKPS